MAVFKSTAFSKLKKSFGNLTACRSRGQNIVKEKVSDVYNPRTLAQQMQRKRHSALVELCEVYDPAIVLGYPSRPSNYSVDNLFLQLNQQAVEVSDKLEVTIDYEKIIVAKGNRKLPDIAVSADADKHQLTFTAEAEKFERHAAADDHFYAAILEQERRKVRVFPLNERENAEPAVVVLPDGWKEEKLTIYVFALSADKKQASLSKCVQPG